MNLLKTGLIVGGGLWLYNAVKTAQAGVNLRTDFAGISKVQIKGSEIVAGLQMYLANPTNQTLKVQFIGLDVLAGQNEIGTVTATPPPGQDFIFDIKGNQQRKVTVPVRLSIPMLVVALGTNVYTAIKQGNWKAAIPQSLNIKGQIKANGFRVGIDEVIASFPNQSPQPQPNAA